MGVKEGADAAEEGGGLAARVAAATARLERLRGAGRESAELADLVAELQTLHRQRPGNPRIAALTAHALVAAGRPSEARAPAQCAVDFRPKAPWAWRCLGVAYDAAHDHPRALEALERGAALEPKDLAVLTALAQTRTRAFRANPDPELGSRAVRDITAAAELALAQGANEPAAELWYMEARLQKRLGDVKACVAACERSLAADPSHDSAAFLLHVSRDTAAAEPGAAGWPPPTRAPEKYVRLLYNGYADRFDDHLVNKLQYRTPKLILEALQSAQVGSVASCADLGCGTGLGAAALHAAGLLDGSRTCGVDLSENMVDKARGLGIYSELAVCDISSWLAACAADSYDLMMSSDVLVYFGDLREIFISTSRALRAGGHFAFSVESPVTLREGFKLQETRRFAHSLSYLQSLLDEAGLDAQVVHEGVKLRLEGGEDVLGTVIVARKQAAGP